MGGVVWVIWNLEYLLLQLGQRVAQWRFLPSQIPTHRHPLHLHRHRHRVSAKIGLLILFPGPRTDHTLRLDCSLLVSIP